MIPDEKGNHKYHPQYSMIYNSAMPERFASEVVSQIFWMYKIPMLSFKAHSMKQNPCLILLKRPITSDFRGYGLRRKPMTAILLK